jgi:NAD(P)-dependent dehydrogenase (short-subunit alcohol dehydrogenase family)
MDLGLRDRIVVVTGASMGIGFACAQAFAREGARVALVSRSRAHLDAALARIRDCAHEPVAFPADLTDAAQALAVVDAIESTLGPIDVLVSSAGAAKRYTPDDLDAHAWHAAMDAKFFSYIHPLDAVVKRMAARGRGSVINIIGVGGKIASPVHLPGGAANAALMLAPVGLAAANGPKGVRVNGINPGGTLTGRVQQGLDAEAKLTGLAPDAILERQQASLPLRRLGTPEEVAQVALFLASELASYVTGALVPMDGGAGAVV